MNEVTKYTDELHHSNAVWAQESAKEIWQVLDFLGYKYESIIDIGCGCGAFLIESKLKWNGDYIGVDYGVNNLLIPNSKYMDVNLAENFPVFSRRFDLVLCLETAEHLPESKAEDLVEYLTRLSDKVLFSAAIPGQGGLGHINEQWQSWWAEKFFRRGYYYKELRPMIWLNPRIKFWYKQNMFLYVKNFDIFQADMLDVVHPDLWRLK